MVILMYKNNQRELLEWLKTSSASLSKLEGIQPVTYNVGLIRTTDLKTRSSSRNARDVPYTHLETNPPLSSLSSQKTAWESSPSVFDLIHQQEERKKQLKQKPPRRPWSGRKTPASVGLSGAKTGVEKECSQMSPKISVLGSQYQPQSRPPSGRPLSGKSVLGSSRPVGHEEIISEKQKEDWLFEEFIATQERYTTENVKDPQKSPSPSHDVQSEDRSKEETSPAWLTQPDKETALKKTGHQSPGPKLLRKPTPEPIRLSMTLPQTNNWSDNDEEEHHSLESCSVDEDVENIELESVTSEISTSHLRPPSTEQMSNHGGITRVLVTPRNDTPSIPCDASEEIVDGINHCLNGRDDDLNKEAKDENGKREENFNKTLKEGVNCPWERPAEGQKANLELKHVPKPPRPRSSHVKGRSRPLPKVELDYEDEGNKQKRTTKGGIKATGCEVETMMSRLALNDKMDGGISENEVQKVHGEDNVAEYGKRTFQKSSSSFNKPFSELSARNHSMLPETKLTTKTVEFSSEGLKEKVEVSVLQKMPEKDKNNRTVFVPRRSPKVAFKTNVNNSKQSSLGQEATGNTESERMHSNVMYPMMINSMKISERPQSRMSHREADGHLGLSDGERNTSPDLSSQEKCREQGNRSPKSPSSHRKIGNKSSRQRPKSAGISSKSHDYRHRGLQRASTSVKLHTNSARTLTPQPRRAVDAKRNREAVKALRDGTLTSSKKYIQEDFPVEDIKPVSPARRKAPSDSDSDSSSSDSDYDIPKSAQEEEVFAVRQKLRQGGVDVPFKMLKRGLLSPSERGYDECMSQLPQKPSVSLLNEPEVWLGKVFRKYKLAEKALQRANERMIIQAEMEAKAAAKEKEITEHKTKKRRKTKGSKRKGRSKVKSTGVT